MKSPSLLLIALGLLSMTACSGSRTPEGAASATTNDLAQQELTKLQGTWKTESSIWNGVPESGVALNVTMIFEDDKFIVVDLDGNRQQEKIQLMPDKNPKAIDCWSKDGGGQPTPGIYSLEGDTMTWCSQGGSHRVRPTSFSSEPGSRRSLLVLKRQTSK